MALQESMGSAGSDRGSATDLVAWPSLSKLDLSADTPSSWFKSWLAADAAESPDTEGRAVVKVRIMSF